jgi:hypothetical protein
MLEYGTPGCWLLLRVLILSPTETLLNLAM